MTGSPSFYGSSKFQTKLVDITTVRAYVVRDANYGCMRHVTTKHFRDGSLPSLHVWLCPDHSKNPDIFDCQDCETPNEFEVEFLPSEYLSSQSFVIYYSKEPNDQYNEAVKCRTGMDWRGNFAVFRLAKGLRSGTRLVNMRTGDEKYAWGAILWSVKISTACLPEVSLQFESLIDEAAMRRKRLKRPAISISGPVTVPHVRARAMGVGTSICYIRTRNE